MKTNIPFQAEKEINIELISPDNDSLIARKAEWDQKTGTLKVTIGGGEVEDLGDNMLWVLHNP